MLGALLLRRLGDGVDCGGAGLTSAATGVLVFVAAVSLLVDRCVGQ